MEKAALTRWTLLDFAPGEGLAAGAAVSGGEGWIDIPAPGDVYLALVAADRLAHPFQGRNEEAARWVRDREWWQRTVFVAPRPRPDEIVELVFDGLDTFATVYLDGQVIGRTDNMFRRYAFDITDRVTPGGRHMLAICFAPPSLAAPESRLPVWSAFRDRVSQSRRNLMRKAQFGWGWDWGPDLPTVGIWREARLECRPRARLAGVRFTTLALEPGRASCEIAIETEAADAAGHELYLALRGPGGALVFEHHGPLAARVPFTVTDPEIWWTADLGGRPLYDLHVALVGENRPLDGVHHRVGIRTIALDTSPDPDEPGTDFFRFVLNGTPIFAKGACWVPASSFVGAVDADAYRRLIARSAAANMNMIRVWGGGIYEPDLFYDLCDEAGLLVWQDFMFACAHYPEDDAFQASVRAEVEDQVRRLRHHPSLALWCGNNECQAMHRINNDAGGETGPLSGLALYDRLIPETLGGLDPAALYWPSSPWGGPNPNSMRSGDVHDWTVWHGIPPIPDAGMVGPFQSSPEGIDFTRYAEDASRFVSEFGIQAAPALVTLERWMDAADLTPESEGFQLRIRDEARKAEALMSRHTGAPETLQDYVDFTQWIQAEGLKTGIEHFRRRMPHCSGALLWQLNDCWPSVSWSLIDHDGVEKAGYHAVRRAFAPVLASFVAAENGLAELWITNDRRHAVTTEFTVSLETFTGEILHRETLSAEVPALAHAIPWRGPGPRGNDQVLRVFSPDFGPNRLFPAPLQHLAFPASEPTVTSTAPAPDTLNVTLTSPTYLPFVHITSPRPDLTVTDNHFDLAPGDSVTITISAPTPQPHDIAIGWWKARA